MGRRGKRDGNHRHPERGQRTPRHGRRCRTHVRHRIVARRRWHVAAGHEAVGAVKLIDNLGDLLAVTCCVVGALRIGEWMAAAQRNLGNVLEVREARRESKRRDRQYREMLARLTPIHQIHHIDS